MTTQKKCSPALRFVGFTDDWEQRKLGEILSLLKDGTHRTHKDVKNGVYLLSAKNIKDGRIIIDENDRKISIEDYEKIHSSFSLQKGDILLTIVGTIGDSAILLNTQKVTFQRSVAYLRSEILTPEYLYSLISNQNFQKQLKNKQVTSAQSGIYLGDLYKILVSYPEKLEEQTKIGNFFKQLDETIVLHKRKLKKQQNLKKFYLEKMFPKKNSLFPEIRFPNFTDAWEQRKLGDISIFFSGGTPSVNNQNFYNGNIPFIRSGDIHSHDAEIFISQEALEYSSAKLVKKGDILYALYGATSGEVARSQLNGAINQAVLAIIPDKNQDPEFIMQWLARSKKYIIQNYLQGGQGNLSSEIVKKLQISKPKKLEEQTQIGNFFKQLDETIALHKRMIEKLEKIKQAYLKKMFI